MSDYRYSGTELDLFARAINWKHYWRSQLADYVSGCVLEVGAGNGNNTLLLVDLGKRPWLCVEPDASLCERLRAAVSADTGVSVMQGTIHDVASGPQFDTILYLDVLEHIESDRSELQEAASRLRAGGHLVVLGPAHQWLYSPFDDAVGHVRRYSRSTLREVAPPDLQLVTLRYLDCAGALASLGNRLFLRQSVPTADQLALWDSYLVPVSRRLDAVFRYRCGKSILGVWRRPRALGVE